MVQMVSLERQLVDVVFAGLFGEPPPAPPLPEEVASLTAFKRRIYRRYEHARHLALIDEKLMEVTRYVETGGKEGIGRLIITMPPRYGKTLTVSRLFPPWHLGRNPRHRVMMVSNSQSLADKNSRVARNFIKSRVYHDIFPQTQLAPDSQNVSEWDIADTDGEGGASALGMFGSSQGKGAHIMIFDDMIKNREQVESQTQRDKIDDAYTDDFLSRLEPGGAIIIMNTRWHQDDQVGRVVKREGLKIDGGKWVILNLPALAIEGDAMGRAIGEPLWAERYPLAEVLERRDSMGPYGWSSTYQQDPKPAEGNIYKEKWFKPYTRVMPPYIRTIRYWDLAMSEKTTADFTVGLRLNLCQDMEHYVDDIARAQVELHDLPRFIKDVILADGPKVAQGFEMKGYMTRAVTALAKDPELSAYILRGYNVEHDKLTRTLPFAARASLGLIHVVIGAAGMKELAADVYVEELKAFPNGAYDDQVDASSGAWEMIYDKTLFPTPGGIFDTEQGNYA